MSNKKEITPGDVAWLVKVEQKKILVEHVFVDAINNDYALVIDHQFDKSINCDNNDLFPTLQEAVKEMNKRLAALL